MVYVFDQNQELTECCGCSVSDSGLRTLSLLNDLTANPLTGTKSPAGTVMVIPSDIGQNPQCDPGSLTPTGVILGWETNDQALSNGTFQVTDTSFASAPLNSGTATNLAICAPSSKTKAAAKAFARAEPATSGACYFDFAK